MEAIYPMFLEPVYKNYIWGGTRIKNNLQKNTPYEKTAESWEISANKNGQTIIKNGAYKGKTITELFNSNLKDTIFGTKCNEMDVFPLLIKFIDAENNLSVQVHPDDEYAKKFENDIGKTEMWYIMDCQDNCELILGLDEKVTNENKSELLTQKNIEGYLKKVKIHKGDIIYIPSGTVHAILSGAFICEIQQNSDITYRLYDWNRVGADGKPRELHLQKALDVIKVKTDASINTTPSIEGKHRILEFSKFKVDKIKVNNEFTDTINNESFCTMNVVNGKGTLIYKEETFELKIGDGFILPANLGEYKIQGKLEILKTYL